MDCLYAHDEYDGASADVGLNRRAHCARVQLKQVETVLQPVPVLQHHLHLALGWDGKRQKVNTTHTKTSFPPYLFFFPLPVDKYVFQGFFLMYHKQEMEHSNS